MERQTLTVPEVAALLGVSLGAAYKAIQRGEIPSIRVGKRVLVNKVVIERMLTA